MGEERRTHSRVPRSISVSPVVRLFASVCATSRSGRRGGRACWLARGERSFADLADFCRRTRLPRPLVGDLIRAGALDGFGVAKRQLLWALGGLQYDEAVLIEAPDIPADLPDLTEREAMSWDYELLGLSPDDHPLRLWRARLHDQGVLSVAELMAQPTGKLVKVAGMVVVRQAPPTAKGHLFITLEDETGLVNLIIRPDLHEHAGEVAPCGPPAPGRRSLAAGRRSGQCAGAGSDTAANIERRMVQSAQRRRDV